MCHVSRSVGYRGIACELLHGESTIGVMTVSYYFHEVSTIGLKSSIPLSCCHPFITNVA